MYIHVQVYPLTVHVYLHYSDFVSCDVDNEWIISIWIKFSGTPEFKSTEVKGLILM